MKKSSSKSTEPKSHTQKVSSSSKDKTKNYSYTQGDKISEDIDEILFDISLKKPKTAYNFFIVEMMEKDKSVKNVTEASKMYAKKWPKISNAERKKYDEMAENDKERYAHHLELVRKNILEKPVKEDATAYRLFLEDYVRKAIERDEDPKEAKKVASEEWKKTTPEQRKEWNDKKKEHAEWYENLKKSGKGPVNSYTLFLSDQMALAREKGEPVTFKDISEKWKHTKAATKEKYIQYAEDEREEREKKRNLYEIAYGIKPSRPLGAFKFFLMESAKEKKFEGKNPLVEGHKLWKKLSKEQKDRYERMAQKERLAYMVKKIEYEASIKKTSTYRPLSALNHFMQEMKDSKSDYGTEGYFNFCYKKWNKMDEAAKKKYHKMAEDGKAESAKINEELKSRVHDQPKRPGNAYTIYIQHVYGGIKEKHPNKESNEIFALCGEQWSKMNEKQKEKYSNQYEKNLELYKSQLSEFHENGYYTPDSKQQQGSSRKRKSSQKRAESTGKRPKKAVKE